MTRYSYLREISILPCLSAGLNVSKAQFLALVESRKGNKLTSSKAHGPDPSDGNVTIETLQRAAAIVGRRVQLELV